MSKNLNQRIRQILKLRNLTQKELASEIGAAESAVSRWLNGSRCPSAINLKKMSEALCVSTDYLLGVTDEYNTDWDYEYIRRRTRKWVDN